MDIVENNRLVVSADCSIPLDEVGFSFARSSGPGGQNVNKVSSKAVLRWSLLESGDVPEDAKKRFAEMFPSYLTEAGEVVLAGQRFRDAPKNKDDCLQKLRDMLSAALKRPKKRILTRPTKGSIRRRLASKARESAKKRLRGPVHPDD